MTMRRSSQELFWRCGRSRSRSVKPWRCDGFTIVELLVVIAVISLIVGLLVPAMSSARATSRSAKCQLNLKQMAIAAQNYAAIYDAWPAAIRYENKNGVFQRVAWDWVTTFSNQVVSPGPLWAFTDNPDEVQQCPDCNLASTFGGDPFTGYNYNTTYIGAEAPFPLTGWKSIRKGVPPHACARSSSCAMFGDGAWKGGANKFMRAPLNSEHQSLGIIYSGGQAFRHARWSNVAFVDGHVGSLNKPHAGALATPANLDQKMDYPRNGFLSDDDRLYDPR